MWRRSICQLQEVVILRKLMSVVCLEHRKLMLPPKHRYLCHGLISSAVLIMTDLVVFLWSRVKSWTQRTRSGVMNLSWDIVRVHGHCIQQLVLETKLYVHGTHRSSFAVKCQCWSFLDPWLHLSSILVNPFVPFFANWFVVYWCNQIIYLIFPGDDRLYLVGMKTTVRRMMCTSWTRWHTDGKFMVHKLWRREALGSRVLACLLILHSEICKVLIWRVTHFFWGQRNLSLSKMWVGEGFAF